MMGCFSTSHTDGTEESHHISLSSLMAARQTPVPSSSMAKKIIERKLGLSTRKTLQARTNLLDTACHNLAKAKQRTLVSFPPSYYLKSDTTLFPLPLPPGYKPSTNNIRNTTKSSSLSKCKSVSKSSSNAIKSNRIDVNCSKSSSNLPTDHPLHVHSTSSSMSSNSPKSPCHSHSNSTTTCHSSCEALTPTSTTSSSVFSGAPSSLSQSSSFSSSSTNSNELRCNPLAHAILENENSPFTALPLPSAHKEHVEGSPLKEFSPLEIARVCNNFDDIYKLRDGSMGPLYRAFLPEEDSMVAIAKVTTELSRKKWRGQMQMLGRLKHPNICKVIGFAYERGTCRKKEVGMGSATGFIVYESMGKNESLEEFVQDVEKGHSHIDWSTRLKIAIGVAEGLSFLLQNHVSYGDLTMSNILVDLSSNAKLFDFILSSTTDQHKEKKSIHVTQALGKVLVKLFDFVSDPQDGDALALRESSVVEKVYPPKDSKVVIQLATRCLLVEDCLCPSIQHVTHVLHSIEPTRHVSKFSIKRSKSFTYIRQKSLSFG